MSQLLAPPKNICVVRLSAIGDTCHALTVVRNLQDNWPGARITWVIGKTEATLLSGVQGVEFITFDKAKGLRAYREIKDALASRSFDVVLCMHASMRANLLYRTISAVKKIGFDKHRARDFQWLFTNERIPAAPQQHALDAMMGFARAIGAEPTPVRWDIPIAQPDRDFAGSIAADKFVAISPCSSQRNRNFRNWPAENYAAIATRIKRRGHQVVLTGGTTALEREYGDRIGAAMGDDEIVDLIGKTSLKQLLAVFEAAAALVCPDSGPAHMATAVGTPVVGLYAGSNPGRTGPYLQREFTINRYPDAVRRYLRSDPDSVRWGRRVRHPAVMDLITIDDVSSKIDAICE